MRIVQINGGAKGSTGKIMMGIAEVARAQGHEVLCASPITSTNRDAGADCGYYRIGTYNSRRMNVALARITGYNGCFAWIETHKLLKEIDKFHPDIIHLHNLHDSYINLPMLFSYIKKHDIPVVWTLHDCWSFTGQCPHFTMVKCDEWKTGCHDCPQYKEYPSSLYDNTKMMWRLKKKWFTGVKNMTIVTPSKWLAGLVKESYLRDYPVQVINNGIDLNVFKPAEGGGNDKYIVLFVSFGWNVYKGIDVIQKLSELLNDSYQLVVVGTDDFVDAMLPMRVKKIHRIQNQAELARLYSRADVLANPTREEILGMVNIEANACGTPVVTFNTGGSPECIGEQGGIVVEKDNVNEMCKAIISVCETKCFSKKMCVKQAAKFEQEKKYAEYIGLYNRIKEK